MSRPLVSVIIPTYKRTPQMINRAIMSVVNQTYTNLEIIIVDDSPESFKLRKDVEKSIYAINDSRIIYIMHEKNLGANKARNTGILSSRGEFCAFLDDDDEWSLNKIELQLAKMRNKNVGLVYCKAEILNEELGITRPMLNKLKNGSKYNELLKQNFIGSNSFVLIRKSVFDIVGNYDEHLLSNQDYDLFLRICKKFEIDYVDKVLVKYYEHTEERITTNVSKQLQGRIGLYNKHYEDIKSDKNLKKIWEIKTIPLYFKNKNFKIVLLKTTNLFFSSPLFFIKYSLGTIQYRKKVEESKKNLRKDRKTQ